MTDIQQPEPDETTDAGTEPGSPAGTSPEAEAPPTAHRAGVPPAAPATEPVAVGRRGVAGSRAPRPRTPWPR